MTWWYVSSPVLTCAVEVRDDRIVGGAPIIKRFIGQSPKSLGNWLRSQGEVRFEKLSEPPPSYTYGWGNNDRRATLKGRRCRILRRGTMHTVLLEFEDGERVTSSFRALRREKG